MTDMFEKARRTGVPIVAVQTADQQATMTKLARQLGDKPLLQWDSVRGISAAITSTSNGNPVVSEAGAKAMADAGIDSDGTVRFTLAMMEATRLPRLSVLFVHNAHRFLQSVDPMATAQNIQAVSNLRDLFKANFRMVVLLGPAFTLPVELARDVVLLSDPLPTSAELGEIVSRMYDAAKKIGKPSAEVLRETSAALGGLSTFEAEQITAMSLTAEGANIPEMWESKRVAIEQTPGMSVSRATTRFADLRGLENVKRRLLQHRTTKVPVGVVVWIDEGADVFSNVEHDTSGVKTDQQRQLLVDMELNGWRGMAMIGAPGTGKTEIARAFGNEVGVPTIALDLSGMQSKYVGESEANLRHAMNVIKQVGNGHAFFILTANSLRGIRPQFQRRFRRGTFFFDIPSASERDAIWQYYMAKYELPTQPRPADESWTGAEIRECVESAWDTGSTLIESSQYVVPVAVSRAVEIEQMRKEADKRFLDASKPGVYEYRAHTSASAAGRSIELPVVALPSVIADMPES